MNWRTELKVSERQMSNTPDEELDNAISRGTAFLEKAKPHTLNGLILVELYMLFQEKRLRSLIKDLGVKRPQLMQGI